MRPTISGISILLLVSIFAACAPERAHEEEVERWFTRRVESLTAPDGWLSVTGLYWLRPGQNTFGSSDSNDIVFPVDSLPVYMGTFYVEQDSVEVVLAPEVERHSSYPAGTRMGVLTDRGGEPTTFTYDALSWYVIDRGGALGIRLIDTASVARRTFEGIERYPLDPRWRVAGKFRRYDPPKSMPVPTVLNTTETLTTPGAVEFTLNGETYRLDVAGEPDARRLWIIFGDPTNQTETYPAGRYVYIDAPAERGSDVVIDFNMAYNPPCAFTDYATCPFPPPQNRLKIPVEAGEKRFELH